MLPTIKKLIWVSRPISWLNTAFPFAVGYLIAGEGFDAVLLVGTLYFLLPYNLLMYGINDVFDYESDIRNPRKGGIEGMQEQRSFHPIIVKAALISNIPFLSFLFLAGTKTSQLVLFGLIFLVLAYSVPWLRFKEKPFLDSITSSLHFVGPLVFALTATSFTTDAVAYVIAFFLWGMASHAFGAVQDILPDREANLSSIATALGARTTVWFSCILYIAASVILAGQGITIFAVAVASLLYAFNCVPYLSVTNQDSAKTNKGWRRFIWLNMFVGFVVTITLILIALK